MDPLFDVKGAAALSICESLLLCLTDRDLLQETEVIGILEDAAASHSTAAEHGEHRDRHRAVAALISAIITGGNSVRHKVSTP
jgi:hypothetical protein